VNEATAFCATYQVILPAIEQLTTGSMERLQRIDDAVNALISPDPLRREFLAHERLVATLYGAVKPDPAALEFAGRVARMAAIAEANGRWPFRCLEWATDTRSYCTPQGVKLFRNRSGDYQRRKSSRQNANGLTTF
jgi:hypothetical protein